MWTFLIGKQNLSTYAVFWILPQLQSVHTIQIWNLIRRSVDARWIYWFNYNTCSSFSFAIHILSMLVTNLFVIVCTYKTPRHIGLLSYQACGVMLLRRISKGMLMRFSLPAFLPSFGHLRLTSPCLDQPHFCGLGGLWLLQPHPLAQSICPLQPMCPLLPCKLINRPCQHWHCRSSCVLTCANCMTSMDTIGG